MLSSSTRPLLKFPDVTCPSTLAANNTNFCNPEAARGSNPFTALPSGNIIFTTALIWGGETTRNVTIPTGPEE